LDEKAILQGPLNLLEIHMHNQDFSYTRTYRGPVKLVVFDWAGTAVDFGCQAPIIAFMEGFKQRGVEVTMEQARAPMGMEKRAHIEAVLAMDEVAALWRSVHGKDATDEDIDSMYEDFVPHLLSILPNHSQLIPDVADAISALRADGVKIGATTGYFHEAAEVVVRAAAAAGYIPDAHLCASDVRQGRPSPAMVHRIMELLDIYPPEAVVNVGDTVVDIHTGLNGGVWSVGVAATGNETGLGRKELEELEPARREAKIATARSRLIQAGAHFVIDTMAELPGIIDTINGLLKQGKSPYSHC
jgi:phosphonoacetaldehyde hydrolase